MCSGNDLGLRHDNSPVSAGTLRRQFHPLRTDLVLHNLAEPEIGHLRNSDLVKQDVARLQIIVYDPLRSSVEVNQARKNLDQNAPSVSLR